MSPALPLIVVGAGPAGIAAAVEARRSEAQVVLLDSSGVAGGGIHVAYEVRNVPFLPDRIPGAQVADGLRSFAGRWGLDVVGHQCVSVARDGDAVVVATHAGARFRGSAVIVATGTTPVLPIIVGLPASFETPWASSAPDALVAGPIQSAAVVGGSDVAFDQARWLKARGIATTVLCRAASPKAPRWLVEAALSEGVDIRLGTRVRSGSRGSSGLVLQLDASGTGEDLAVDRVVAAIGRQPAWRDSIAIAPEAMSLVRIAGDATGRRARHVAAALGDGCKAAAELLGLVLERRG